MKTLLQAISSLMILLAVSLPAGSAELLVYVGTYTRGASKGIYAYRLDDATGKLTPLGLAAETANPSFVAIHPNRRFLYAVGEDRGARSLLERAAVEALNDLFQLRYGSSRRRQTACALHRLGGDSHRPPRRGFRAAGGALFARRRRCADRRGYEDRLRFVHVDACGAPEGEQRASGFARVGGGVHRRIVQGLGRLDKATSRPCAAKPQL